MKFTAVLVVLFVFVNLSEQIPKLINCPPNFIAHEAMNDSKCELLNCKGQPNIVSVAWCGLNICPPSKYIGYKQEDHSKVYPECCGGPICAD